MTTSSTPTEASTGKSAAPLKLSLVQRTIKQQTKLVPEKRATVALAAAAVYLLDEVVQGALEATRDDGKQKISPRAINSAINRDTELHAVGAQWLVRSGSASPVRAARNRAGSADTTATEKTKSGSAAHEYGGAVRRIVKAHTAQASGPALQVLSAIASSYVGGLADIAGELANKVDRKTVTADDILGAVGVQLRGELKTQTETRINDALSGLAAAKE
ncbi:hypothetical protein GCM10010331_16210 [Streptomyces xanthochromogenes]|uniref:histone-like protein n=1 Tax=Streptomyces xanthochromogenes TaxID=67384 RepID=UPI001676F8CD|nr:histone-like protein [Streptomyces xanthochromogenes]GHB30573.1 hypothetical protein GCM10010331_16210 [Streptomyces xanthochromogenes]